VPTNSRHIGTGSHPDERMLAHLSIRRERGPGRFAPRASVIISHPLGDGEQLRWERRYIIHDLADIEDASSFAGRVDDARDHTHQRATGKPNTNAGSGQLRAHQVPGYAVGILPVQWQRENHLNVFGRQLHGAPCRISNRAP